MKECSRCRRVKPFSEFSKRSDQYAYKSHCRACKKDYDKTLRSQLPSQRKNTLLAVVEVWGEKCFYCGETERLEIDHILVGWRGGSDDLVNMVPACRSCNASKGSRTPGEWLALRKKCAIHKVAPGGSIVSQCYKDGKRKVSDLV